MLAVILTHFNPIGFQRLRANYLETLKTFRLQCPAGTVFNGELCYDASPTVDPQAIRVQGGTSNLYLWQKENIATIVIGRLPEKYDKVLIADADTVYSRPDWYEATEAALDEFDVLQNWETCHWEDRHGRIERSRIAVTKDRQFPNHSVNHPGFNWAWRREAFVRTGVYCLSHFGSGDSILAWALYGTDPVDRVIKTFPPHDTHNEFRERYQSAGLKTGYIAGDLTHKWHGSLRDRQYQTRRDLMVNAGFRSEYIYLDADGLLSWKSDTPQQVRNAARKYFVRRQEDG